jgi:plasmid stabilization system protein ParE
MRVKLIKSAYNDLKDIRQYLLLKNVSNKIVRNLVNEIITDIEILEKYPYAGRVVPEYEDKLVRELIRNNYRIIYMITDDLIRVIHIMHQARLLSNSIQ